MTRNQRRAIRLAQGVFDGRMAAGELHDDDWMLLVMAAGMNYHKTPPGTISRKVLSDARGREGYFYTGGGAGEPAPDSCRTAPSAGL